MRWLHIAERHMIPLQNFDTRRTTYDHPAEL